MLDRYSEVVGTLAPVLAGSIVRSESMARHTSFHIGGPAALFVECANLSDLSKTLFVLDKQGIPWTVVGKGSNLLVSDEGYNGAVIVLGREFRNIINTEDGFLSAGAGVQLSRLVQDAFRQGLGGLEFAVGIPGTLGGAIRMNAGTSNEWIGERIHSVTVLQPHFGLKSYRGEDILWGYRSSSIPSDEVIVEACICVKPAQMTIMQAKMEAALKRRKKTQPVNVPNAGSIFRNPDGGSAGSLIESVGLKGFTIGGACISETHANFIVNLGEAKAADVRALMLVARSKVREAHGIELTPEVRFLGFAQDE